MRGMMPHKTTRGQTALAHFAVSEMYLNIIYIYN